MPFDRMDAGLARDFFDDNACLDNNCEAQFG